MYADSMQSHLGGSDVIAVINALEFDQENVEYITKCMFEAAGKLTSSEFAAIKGVRDWLGVPRDVNDGRVLSALIEVVLQSSLVDYTVQALNKEELIHDINRASLEKDMFQIGMSLLATAYISMWYGMSKTLINTQWSLWKVTEEVPESTVRLKIAKKIDKYC